MTTEGDDVTEKLRLPLYVWLTEERLQRLERLERLAKEATSAYQPIKDARSKEGAGARIAPEEGEEFHAKFEALYDEMKDESPALT